ncbi:hypothetical protein HK414_12505 [Ramlibacter terrae]|uniref:Uncharacterized protein n=1 Tax=Ramlibacter terrae TaxID=2732511 RepID=A0ABX6P4L9_9BURK|nr:hypothetical protein HK414_12505 [Ramlibacter terrae]
MITALPIGDLFQSFVDKDPRWPLGDKASRVSGQTSPACASGCRRPASRPSDCRMRGTTPSATRTAWPIRCAS